MNTSRISVEWSGQTILRQRWTVAFDILALIFSLSFLSMVQIPGSRVAVFCLAILKMTVRGLTEVGVQRVYRRPYRVVREQDEIMRIDEETKDIQRSLAFQISFVLGTILLYSAIIMALWWIAAIRACYQTSSWEVLVRSVIFGGVLFALFEVPYRSFPLLMPWFKDSVLIVAYWVLFGIAIDRPRGRQRLSEFRSWLVTVLILGIGLVLILFSLRVCATMLMPCITSAFIAATLFKLDADRAGSRGPG